MNKLASLVPFILLLNSCSLPTNSKDQQVTVDSTSSELRTFDVDLNEPLKEATTELTLADLEEDSIAKPDWPIFKNIEVDTTELFGIWTVDPKGPHADFWLTKDSYYVVDYDGVGDMPYILNGRTITIFFEHGKQVLEILSTSNDTLRTFSKEYEYEAVYTRWEN
jgi:hypothetical protein